MVTILISVWEALLVLIIVIALTGFVLRWFWQQRLADIRQTLDQKNETARTDFREEFGRRLHIEIRDITSDFKHQASHCLRPIKDNLYLLKREMQGREVEGALSDSLADIEHYEWRLTRLIENMGLVSSLEVSDHSYRFSEVKLDAIVSDVVNEFGNPTRKNGATVIRWTEPEDFPFIPANAEGLRQVFINLIDNAIKYSGDTGEVGVSLGVDDNLSIVSAEVSDNGPGIPQEDWERIFDRGYRVEDARDRKPKEVGQGLGLYIARLVVEKHNGHINVTSELGKGTTFTITLPIQSVSVEERAGQR